MKTTKRLIIMLLVVATVLTATVIPASAVGQIAYGAATVSASSLYVRSGPGTSYNVTSAVFEGDVVVILERTSETWYKINCAGNVGYVSANYLTDVLTAENFSAKGAVTGDSVRMREKPDTASDVLGTYKKGTEMTVIGINNGWYKVKYDGKTGYLRSDYMDIVGAVDNPGEKPASSSSTGNKSLGQQIADYALQFVGYRYVYGAESPSVGFDCSGLVYYVYGKFGYDLERRASLQYRDNGRSVSKSELQPGDLVFFSSNGNSVTHVGMYIGNNDFVHASTSNTGVIISSLTSAYYTRVWFGAKRIV